MEQGPALHTCALSSELLKKSNKFVKSHGDVRIRRACCVGRLFCFFRRRRRLSHLASLYLIPQFLVSTSLLRACIPEQHDELVVLRLRTKKGEFIMTPDEGFSMVVFQDPNYVEPPPDPKAAKAPAAGDEKKASA